MDRTAERAGSHATGLERGSDGRTVIDAHPSNSLQFFTVGRFRLRLRDLHLARRDRRARLLYA